MFIYYYLYTQDIIVLKNIYLTFNLNTKILATFFYKQHNYFSIIIFINVYTRMLIKITITLTTRLIIKCFIYIISYCYHKVTRIAGCYGGRATNVLHSIIMLMYHHTISYRASIPEYACPLTQLSILFLCIVDRIRNAYFILLNFILLHYWHSLFKNNTNIYYYCNTKNTNLFLCICIVIFQYNLKLLYLYLNIPILLLFDLTLMVKIIIFSTMIEFYVSYYVLLLFIFKNGVN